MVSGYARSWQDYIGSSKYTTYVSRSPHSLIIVIIVIVVIIVNIGTTVDGQHYIDNRQRPDLCFWVTRWLVMHFSNHFSDLSSLLFFRRQSGPQHFTDKYLKYLFPIWPNVQKNKSSFGPFSFFLLELLFSFKIFTCLGIFK